MTYPFTAIVGQDETKLALLLCAVNPRIGGVVLSGEKGTAKSTVVRGLAELLPSQVMRTLALGATEDRLVGGLDLEATLTSGRPVLQPGLLSEVDGGVLYVDEVNLLDDHLVDLVIDACAGTVRVEREGLKAALASRFVLVGTMNPEGSAATPVARPVRTVRRGTRRGGPGGPCRDHSASSPSRRRPRCFPLDVAGGARSSG